MVHIFIVSPAPKISDFSLEFWRFIYEWQILHKKYRHSIWLLKSSLGKKKWRKFAIKIWAPNQKICLLGQPPLSLHPTANGPLHTEPHSNPHLEEAADGGVGPDAVPRADRSVPAAGAAVGVVADVQNPAAASAVRGTWNLRPHRHPLATNV